MYKTGRINPATFDKHMGDMIGGAKNLFECARIISYENQIGNDVPEDVAAGLIRNGLARPPSERESLGAVPSPAVWLQSTLDILRVLFDAQPIVRLMLDEDSVVVREVIPNRPFRWICMSQTTAPGCRGDIGEFWHERFWPAVAGEVDEGEILHGMAVAIIVGRKCLDETWNGDVGSLFDAFVGNAEATVRESPLFATTAAGADGKRRDSGMRQRMGISATDQLADDVRVSVWASTVDKGGAPDKAGQ